MMIPPRDPMRSGAGGSLTELMTALTSLAAAGLASLMMARPPRDRSAKDAAPRADEPTPDAIPDDEETSAR